MSLRLRRGAAWLTVAALLVPAVPAEAYREIGTRLGTETVTLAWKALPIRYMVSDREVPGVTVDQFRGAVGRAVSTWQAVDTSAVAFAFEGVSGARPLDEDGVNVLGFLDRPELNRVLASTSFMVDTRTGGILESDVFFNSAYAWSVAPDGEAGRFNLEAIVPPAESATCSGSVTPRSARPSCRAEAAAASSPPKRSCSPLPLAPGSILGRTLDPDDIAGVSNLYPDNGFRDTTGSIQGHVRLGGAGVFGAHVVAFNLRTSALVANFSLDDSDPSSSPASRQVSTSSGPSRSTMGTRRASSTRRTR